MKKTYNHPTIKVVKMHPIQMIANSPTTPLGTVIKKGSSASEEIDVLSRSNDSFWDDEDEEEDY